MCREETMRESIDHVDKDLFERVWKLVSEIGVQERHFNVLQSTYRNMASAWLLATFGGIGFALTQRPLIGIDYELLMAGVAAAGCVGIMLLWGLDLLVYQHLLDACFVVGLILEKQRSWLPPLRSNMLASQVDRGVVFLFRLIAFYVAPVALLLILAGGFVGLWFANHQLPQLAPLSALGGFALAVAASVSIYRKTHAYDIVEMKLDEYRKSGQQFEPVGWM